MLSCKSASNFCQTNRAICLPMDPFVAERRSLAEGHPELSCSVFEQHAIFLLQLLREQGIPFRSSVSSSVA